MRGGRGGGGKEIGHMGRMGHMEIVRGAGGAYLLKEGRQTNSSLGWQ